MMNLVLKLSTANAFKLAHATRSRVNRTSPWPCVHCVNQLLSSLLFLRFIMLIANLTSFFFVQSYLCVSTRFCRSLLSSIPFAIYLTLIIPHTSNYFFHSINFSIRILSTLIQTNNIFIKSIKLGIWIDLRSASYTIPIPILYTKDFFLHTNPTFFFFLPPINLAYHTDLSLLSSNTVSYLYDVKSRYYQHTLRFDSDALFFFSFFLHCVLEVLKPLLSGLKQRNEIRFHYWIVDMCC